MAVALGTACPLHATNLLENGHFTSGITHWRGDGKAPADFAPNNPFDKPDPFVAEGLIVPLKHRDWTKVAQDFTGVADTDLTLIIKYKLSEHLAFSKRDDDYGYAMPDPAGNYNSAMKGQWSVFVTNLDNNNETFVPVTPKSHGKDKDVMTVHAKVSGLSSHHANTITLEFPPGEGTVVILSVVLGKNVKADEP